MQRDINITWDVSTLHSKLCTSVWQGRVCCGLTSATNNEPLTSSSTHFYRALQVIRQQIPDCDEVDPGVAECEGSVAECQVSQTEKMMKAVQPVQRL